MIMEAVRSRLLSSGMNGKCDDGSECHDFVGSVPLGPRKKLCWRKNSPARENVVGEDEILRGKKI